MKLKSKKGGKKMEYLCKAKGVPGRLIPILREISVGCGFAWCTDLEQKDCVSICDLSIILMLLLLILHTQEM